MARDNVTFSFRIDSARASAAIKELTQALERLNATNVKVDKNLKTTKRGIDDVGRTSAASAVNFQTATQGMLNLSTAAVQTYTSISNLDRANNRAKMSIIAVARAEDLLNNKKQRLNEMTAQGITSGNKYANMQREIATAESDLTVKIEKRGIEQAAVNDIYMLFATNIANVTISSMQTLAILDKNQIMLTGAKTIAQKISNASMFVGAKAAYAKAAAHAMESTAMAGATGITIGLTGAVHGLTAAVRAFMSSNPLLLAAMALSTVAFAVHETNILGTKSAMDEYLGIQPSFQDEVDASRNATEEFNDALGTQETKLFSLPSAYSGLVRELENIKDKYKDVTAVVKENTNAIIINNSTSGIGKRQSPNFSSGGVTTQQTAAGQAIPQGVYASTDIPFAAYADTGSQQITDQPHGVQATLQNRFVGEAGSRINLPVGTGMQHKMGLIDGKSAPIFGFTKTNDGSYMPQGPSANSIIESFINEAIMEGGKDIAQSLGVTTEEGMQIYVSDPDFLKVKERIILNVIQNKLSGVEGQSFKVFTPDSYVDFKRDEAFKKIQKDIKDNNKNKIKMLGKEKAMRGSMRQLFQTFAGPLGLSDSLFKGTLDKTALKALGGVRYVQGKLVYQEKKARLAPSMLRDALAGKAWAFDEDDPFDQLLRETITQPGGKIFDTGQLNLMFASKDFSPSRKAAYDKYGVDIGKIGDVISKEDAERFGMYQAVGNAMNGQVGGQQYTNLFSSFGGSATAAYQVPRGSIATPKHIMKAIRNQDGFANGIGRYLENLTALLTGKKQKLQYRNSFNHKTQTFIGESRGTLNNALDFGFRANQDFVERLNQSLVGIDPQKEGALQRARQNAESSVSIAEEFLKMQFGLLRGVGIESTTVSAIAGEIGLQGGLPAGFINNLQVLSQMKRSDFNDYDIIHESQNKLNMTHQDVFAIRFDAKRGDDELRDRIRFQDRLESIHSGTAVL